MFGRVESKSKLKGVILPYGYSLVSIAILSITRAALGHELGDRAQFLLLIPGILASTYYGGLGPGLFALALGAFLSAWLIIPPSGSLAIVRSADKLNLFLYFVTGAGIAFMAQRERNEKTRRILAETNLEDMNAKLEVRVQERTAQLELAHKELEGFCYSVSHDLKTPMRAIAGNARIVLEDHAESLDPDIKARLERMEMASTRLGRLVVGLLTYARMANQQIQFEEVDMGEIFGERAEAVAKEMNCEIHLAIQPTRTAYGDRRLLRTAATELLRNAGRYRRDPASACAEFGSFEREGQNVYFLRDSGIGMDMQYAKKIFQPFERLHRDEAYAGIGMGLAHVSRIVERHGGQIWVESELGKGTTFLWTLGNH